MLRIKARCVKLFAVVLVFLGLAQQCRAQENNQDNQLIDTGRTAISTFGGDGLIGQGAKTFDWLQTAQEAYSKFRDGNYGAAIGGVGGALIAGKAIEATLKSGAAQPLGRFCASGALEAGFCVVAITELALKTESATKQRLGEVGDKFQNATLLPVSTPQKQSNPSSSLLFKKAVQLPGL